MLQAPHARFGLTDFALFVMKAARFMSFVSPFIMVLAGLIKALDLQAFEMAISEWRIIPTWTTPLVVFAVPTIEMTMGIWAMLRPKELQPRIVLSLTLLAFSMALLAEYFASGSVACGCFGFNSQVLELPPYSQVLRNFLLIVVMIIPCIVLRRFSFRSGAQVA